MNALGIQNHQVLKRARREAASAARLASRRCRLPVQGGATPWPWPGRPVFRFFGRPGGLYSLREPSQQKAAVLALRVTIPDASLADQLGLSCRYFAAPGALAEQLFESRPGPAGRFASLDSNAIQPLLEGQRNDRHDEQNPLEISTAR